MGVGGNRQVVGGPPAILCLLGALLQLCSLNARENSQLFAVLFVIATCLGGLCKQSGLMCTFIAGSTGLGLQPSDGVYPCVPGSQV